MHVRPALAVALASLALPAAAQAHRHHHADQDSGGGYTFPWQTAVSDQDGQDPPVTPVGDTPPPPDPTPVGQTPAPTEPVPGPGTWKPAPHTDPTTAALARAKAAGLTLHTDGHVSATRKVPKVVRAVIAAANRIARKPYRYGGGHGSFSDTAYDCSGSVSYALHGGGLLDTTLDSTLFERWANKGHGKWITIYANHGHAFMSIAGLRYDTGAMGSPHGSRWHAMDRSTRGFVARHPAGL